MSIESTNDEQRDSVAVQRRVRHDLDMLLEVAASLLMPGNLPSVWLEDWGLPKSTPMSVRRKIHQEASKARAFCGDAAAKLAAIHDRLAANDKTVPPRTEAYTPLSDAQRSE